MTTPYRQSDVKEGVALPRDVRAMRFWAVATVVVAVVAQGGLVLWMLMLRAAPAIGPVTRFEGPMVAPRTTTVLIVASSIWVAVVAGVAARLALGRSQRIGFLLTLALTPVFVAEMLAFRCVKYDLGYFSAEDSLATYGAYTLEPLALYRLPLYAASAVACLVMAVGALGGVMSIRRLRGTPEAASSSSSSSSRMSLIVAVLGFGGAAAFTILRVRGIHRDGLGGALAIMITVLATAAGPLVASRVRSLRDWHDAAEAASAARVATGAFVAFALAGILCERAVLATDETAALAGIQAWAFDVRVEYAHAYLSSWSAHPIGMFFVATIVLLPLIMVTAAARRRRRSIERQPGLVFRGSRAAAIVGMLAFTVTIAFAFFVESRMRSVLASGAFAQPIESGMLPVAPHMNVHPSIGSRLSRGVVTLDRNARIEAVLSRIASDGVVPSRNNTYGVMAETMPERAIGAVGPLRSLLGSRIAPVEFFFFDDPSFKRTDVNAEPSANVFHSQQRGGVLLVIDDGEVGRVVYRKNGEHGYVYGKTRGITFRRDLEARAQRDKLRAEIESEIGGYTLYTMNVVVLAPDPKGTVQEFVDAVIGTESIAGGLTVTVTSDRQAIDEAMTGGVLVSP